MSSFLQKLLKDWKIRLPWPWNLKPLDDSNSLYIKWLFHLYIGKLLFHHFHPFIKEGSQQGSSGQLQKKIAVSDLSKESTLFQKKNLKKSNSMKTMRGDSLPNKTCNKNFWWKKHFIHFPGKTWIFTNQGLYYQPKQWEIPQIYPQHVYCMIPPKWVI